MPRGYRSQSRLRPFTVDYYDKSGRFIMSEEIVARHEEQALLTGRDRFDAYGAANCRVFHEDLAARQVTDDIHRAIREMSSGRTRR